MIRFEQVAKRYPNGHVGLHELSFRARRGEFLFVTGHSGAGKSTLLRLLLAMERPTSGKLLQSCMGVDRCGAAPLGPHAIAREGPGESVVVEHDIEDLTHALLGAGVVETDECLDPPVEVAAHQVGGPDVGRRLTRAVAVREVVNA